MLFTSPTFWNRKHRPRIAFAHATRKIVAHMPRALCKGRARNTISMHLFFALVDLMIWQREGKFLKYAPTHFSLCKLYSWTSIANCFVTNWPSRWSAKEHSCLLPPCACSLLSSYSMRMACLSLGILLSNSCCLENQKGYPSCPTYEITKNYSLPTFTFQSM